MFRKEREGFSSDDIGGIRYRQRPALRDDVGGCVWPPHPRKAGALKRRSRDSMQGHGKEKVIEQTFHQRSTSATSVRKVVFSVDMAVDGGGLRYGERLQVLVLSVGLKIRCFSRIGPGIRFHVIFFRVFRSCDRLLCLVFDIEIEIQPFNHFLSFFHFFTSANHVLYCYEKEGKGLSI